MKGLILLLSIFCINSFAQKYAPFDTAHWKINGKEAVMEEHIGKRCLKLTAGSATLKDVSFLNGIIEFDIALQQAYYFPGIAFRVKDEQNAEYFSLEGVLFKIEY